MTASAKTTKKAPKAAAPADRSKAVAATWTNKKVAAARNLKTKVKVGEYEYRSVAAAFEDLKLPMGQHIKFRQELKASATGRATFKTDAGKSFAFSIVKAAA